MLKRSLLISVAVAAIGVGTIACSDDDPDEPTATPTVTATIPSGDGDSDGDSGAAGGTFPAGTLPISIPDALASDEGPLLVEGYLVITGDGARFCEALAESFPPQCGGASLSVDEPDPSALQNLTTEGDVSWTDQPVQMLGTIDGDTFHVQPLASS